MAGRRDRVRYRDGHMAPGWTYFIHAPSAGRVKIGQTQGHPALRLAELQLASPAGLVGIGLIRGRRFEAVLHAEFAGLRSHGEWFRDDSPLIDFIRAVALPFSAADEIEDEWVPSEEARELDDGIADAIERWFSGRDGGLPESQWKAWRGHEVARGSHI